ncbi:hypothetical protein VP1G_05112 [Cytospora mali]|uniref:Uncharacterized protein n=1 Tax=Cytospora mali TaxID=578113 RepID=A0A194V1L1_CYTMA|nr:hypothetical protein VP1G_05112 [Valsa mali var. pyri (nom. inval.)]
MGSQKTPLSASKRTVPIKISVLHTSDRDNFPYTRVEPRWSFTMNLLPLTNIKELCIHAAGQVRRTFNAIQEVARLEARDRDGHVFHGMETIAEEILNGETIYLVEGAGESAVKRKGKERGRLLSLRSGAEQAYRTPSTSSRSSSTSRKKALSQPKMTPSQRSRAMAKAGLPPGYEPARSRRSSTSAIRRTNSPSPALSHVAPAAALKGEVSNRRDDASSEMDGEQAVPKQQTSIALSQKRSPSQNHSLSPQTSPQLQDSQKIVPDSQHHSPRSPLQSPFGSPVKLASETKPKPGASEPCPTQPRSAPPRLNTLDPGKIHNMPTPPTKVLASRPDPYDISSVLSDNENHSPPRPSSTMSSSVRKLGSEYKRRIPASQPPMRQLQMTTNSPSHISKSATTHRYESNRNMGFQHLTTPDKKTTTPFRVEASSPAVALPSSPTNNVAAAIAKGRSKIKRRSIPECVVIGDSEDEIDEELFRNPPAIPASNPSFEASLPWSQPPLRATQDNNLGARPVARRASMPSAGGRITQPNLVGKEEVVDSTADVRQLIDAVKGTLAATSVNSNLKTRALPSSAISPFHLNSPVRKTVPTLPAGKKPFGQTMTEQPTVTVIDSSSSEDMSDGADKGAPTIKAEQSEDYVWRDLPEAVMSGSLVHQDGGDKEKDPEVIQLSSDSDSSIDPAWLDDYDVDLPISELPGIDEPPVINEPLLPDPDSQDIELPAPVVPLQELNNLVTDPVKPSVNETPPSAQPDKRKRPLVGESDSENDRGKKRVRRAEKRKAKKALRRAKHEELLARMEEERKKLALEQAHLRALELEIIVSSPTKARKPRTDDAEVDDDSGLDLSILDDDKYVEDVGTPLGGDDDNESLSRMKSEDGSFSLDMEQVSSSSESRQDSPELSVGAAEPGSPVSEAAHRQQKQQQDSDAAKTANNQYYGEPFDDWAALEATLGRGGFGYSPLEVHNRIHLATVHRCLQVPNELSAIENEAEEEEIDKEPPFVDPSDDQGDSSTGLTQPVVKVKRRNRKRGKKSIASPSKNTPQSPIHDQPSPRSIRSGAPSPKDTPPAPETASAKGRKKGREGKQFKTKARSRRERDRRRLQRKQRAEHNFSKFRDSAKSRRKNH